jgi:uncharacterized protein (TIGR00369 family)
LKQNEIAKDDIDFLKYIGAEVIDFGDGYAELAFEIQPHHKQHLGVVHGGAIATLADHTGWYAVISELDKEFTSVTIEIKINYLKPANGDILRAQAKVVNRTKRTAFVTIEVLSKDLIVAYATGTYAIIEDREQKSKNAKQ